MKSNGCPTQYDVVALEAVKWMLYNRYSKWTCCNQMDALHAVMQMHLTGPNGCFTRGVHIDTIWLMIWYISGFKWMPYLKCRCTWTTHPDRSPCRWTCWGTWMRCQVWMLYCLGCECTWTPSHYGCPTSGPPAAQWDNFDVPLWMPSGRTS